MKNLTWIPVLIVVGFITILSCGDDDGGGDGDERTAQEIATDSLTLGTWSLANGGSISLDGTDVTDQYTGFTVSFSFSETTANTYNTTNSGGGNGQNRLFSASGTWDWATTDTDNVIDLMDNDKGPLTILNLNRNTLRFRFEQLNDAGAAAGSDGLAGNYEITLTR